MSIFPPRNMNDQNPFTQTPAVFVKSAYNPMGSYSPPKGYRPTTSVSEVVDRSLSPGSFADEFSKSTQRAVPRFTKGLAQWAGTPVDLLSMGLNKATGGWVPRDSFGGTESIRRGLKNIGISTPDHAPQNTWEAVAQGSGNILGFVNPATAALKAPQITNAFTRTAKGLNAAQDLAFNPASLANPARYAANTKANQWATKMPGWLQRWGRRADSGSILKTLKDPTSFNGREFLKNRAAIAASSPLGFMNAGAVWGGANQIKDREALTSNPMSDPQAWLTSLAQESPWLLSKKFLAPFAVTHKLDRTFKDSPELKLEDELYTGWAHNLVGNSRNQPTVPIQTPSDILGSRLEQTRDLFTPEAYNQSLNYLQGLDNLQAANVYNPTGKGGRYLAPGATPFTTDNAEATVKNIWDETRASESTLKNLQQGAQPTETASTPTTQPKLSSWGTEMLMKIVNWLQQTGQTLEGLFAGK